MVNPNDKFDRPDRFIGDSQSAVFSRRSCVKRIIQASVAGPLMSMLFPGVLEAGSEVPNPPPGYDARAHAKEYLKTVLFTKKEVGNWLAGVGDPVYIREKYDAEIGWVHQAGSFKHGVDDAVSLYSYDPSGARRMIMYSDRPCRINTYGNSFTHCDQVSDGETWQERLAAHLGEPVRNFGVSGQSVYQAYLRMKREEARTPGKYIILNIFSDDHYRNGSAWAGLGTPRPLRGRSATRPPAPHVRVNPATDEFRELANPCPTPQSLYKLTDAQWLFDTFKDDIQLKVILAQQNIKQHTPQHSYAAIMALAKKHGIQGPINSPDTLRVTLRQLSTQAALFASMRIVGKVEEFAATHGKKVLYVLSYLYRHLEQALRDGGRFDQGFIDFLQKKGLPYVDDLEAHAAEFAQFRWPVEEYMRRYYIGRGHYNPRGNLFQAFALKNKLVEMLEPKPVTY